MISLECILPKVTTLFLTFVSLSGAFMMSALPQVMEVFSIGCNSFKGTVDFTALSERMQRLFLESNEFTGSAVLD